MLFSAIVVDDEPYAREELIYILSQFTSCQIVGEAGNAKDCISLYSKFRPDVVFLDIEMPDMSGIEIAKILAKFNNPPLIVFATAYEDYAIEAFELGAVDYILKPFEEKRIAKTIMRIENLKSNESEWNRAVDRLSHFLEKKKVFKKLPVQQKPGVISFVPYVDIFYCEASEGGVRIFTLKDEYYFDGTLSELETRLKEEGFMRVHKSFIINLKRIEAVLPWFKGTYWIVIEGKKTQIPVSKSIIKELKEILGIKCSN
ncbi:MAG: LytTR family DNA-binding domain-containing protein [Thermodesulfovibrio sp.]|jgi:two-component system LytT family response regulator/two-component system response regulator LytT|uniref:LytR/AlgR family response regulator transcription factor n=1 Tax=Thermodesulfovibrio sp. 1176 TaxID=3043424 RepID=UPI002482E749|nr:LytTR family DNA-binding domain-containing protein [Thermodesulfovibrio sp. 1176]MDI1472541.1 LytTR family DNA-binding domain-containing protein [Thermodesulfovibrio sp. 1176]MDI6714422.1 LytTR family DNA-binding domain-containing protein [Thermodesulfovibrio sp.]